MTDETCPQCGATIPTGAAFCTSCGTRLADAPTTSAAVTDTPQNEDVTRVEDPGLQGATRVLPETPPASSTPDDPTTGSATGSATPPPQSTPPATFAPPPPAAWGNPQGEQGWGQPAATPPSSWDSPPPAPSSWDQPGTPAAATWPAAATPPAVSTAATGPAPASAVVGVIGALLTIIGLFLPWVSARTGTTLSLVANEDSLTGWALATRSNLRITTNDPYWLLALGIVALIVSLVLFVRGMPLLRIALGLVGLAIVGLTIYDYSSIRSVVQDTFTTQEGIDLRIGLWLSLAGGVVCLVAACLPGSHAPARPDPGT